MLCICTAFFFFNVFIHFIYLAVLGLSCSHGILIASCRVFHCGEQASVVAAGRLFSCGLRAWLLWGRWDLSSPIPHLLNFKADS